MRSKDTFEAIAESDLRCVYPNLRSVKVQFRIGRPYPTEEGDWKCPVAANGLHASLPDMYGVDSWQALNLALRLLEKIAQTQEERGAVFKYPGERKAIDVHSLFSRCVLDGLEPPLAARKRGRTKR